MTRRKICGDKRSVLCDWLSAGLTDMQIRHWQHMPRHSWSERKVWNRERRPFCLPCNRRSSRVSPHPHNISDSGRSRRHWDEMLGLAGRRIAETPSHVFAAGNVGHSPRHRPACDRGMTCAGLPGENFLRLERVSLLHVCRLADERGSPHGDQGRRVSRKGPRLRGAGKTDTRSIHSTTAKRNSA
jgi:hypothetical protein